MPEAAPPQPRSDRELAAACQRNERAAQQELYARFADRLYRLLLKLTRRPDDALDCMQNTFLWAFKRIGQFDGRAALSTWLYRIAVNEALLLARRSAGARAAQDRFARQPAGNGQPTPGLRLDVAHALDRLSAEDQLVLLLRYDQSLDYRTIGEVLGVPGGTVASRLNRARERLRALLSAYGTEETDGAAHPTNTRLVRGQAPSRRLGARPGSPE
jgi:RNA polymerase sigma-70 factor (ECF subfamily)